VEKEYLKLGRSLSAQQASSRRESSRGRPSKNACVGVASVDKFFCGEQAAVTAAALW
jgi:hypothetical protein